MGWDFISNLLLASIRMATPLIFLSLAELYSQRAGLVHIGLEGLASIGSLVGFLVSLITGNPLLGVLASAAAGIGGAYLTTCYTTTYVDGNIAGRGFIALAAVIFGRWNAGGVLVACLFFGFCDALQIRLQVGSYNIPYQFFQMIPYIATVVVLAATGMKKAGPKSCGKPYRKEER